MHDKHSLEALLTLIGAELYEQQRERAEHAGRAAPGPFVTISRQAGAGGRTLGQLVVERLNADHSKGRPWAAWDRELVEQVARERHLPQSVIESLEGAGPSWFEQLFADVTHAEAYRAVVATIRGLARAGRAVIVGRGGVYATEDLPAGVHVRLVAPLASRVAHMARTHSLSDKNAAAEVQRIEKDRREFYRRHWPGRRLEPEIFTVVLNTGTVSEPAQVDCVVRLVRDVEARQARACQAAEVSQTA